MFVLSVRLGRLCRRLGSVRIVFRIQVPCFGSLTIFLSSHHCFDLTEERFRIFLSGGSWVRWMDGLSFGWRERGIIPLLLPLSTSSSSFVCCFFSSSSALIKWMHSLSSARIKKRKEKQRNLRIPSSRIIFRHP